MKRSLLTLAGFAFAAASQAVVINEFVFNHVGTDTNEYVELFGSAGEDFSGLSIIQIEGDSGGSLGFLDTIDVGGTANAGGYWVTPFLGNRFENGSVTLLLVSGLTATTGTDLDTNDDGVLDSTPWTAILDSVAVSDGGASDFVYSSSNLTPTFDGGTFTVGGASRIPNGVDSDAPADWMRNDFDLAGIPGFPGTPIVGEALNTPGAINQAVVPEPATMAALALGAAAMIRRRRA